MPETDKNRASWTGEQFHAASKLACQFALEGLLTDGAHHKQWYLERVAEALGIDLIHFSESCGEYAKGTPP